MPRDDFSDIVELIIRSSGRGVRVGVPGCVVSVDRAAGRVSVLPELTRPRTDPELAPDVDPVLTPVPVVFQSTKAVELNLGIQVGDRGLLLFTDFGLGKWLQGDAGAGVVTPHVGEPHGLAGATFHPGLWPDGEQVVILADGLALGERAPSNAALEVRSGEVRVGRGATEAAILGDAYRSAESTWLAAFEVWAIAVAGAVGPALIAPLATIKAANTAFNSAGAAALASIAKVK